ncbi:hypothetical protein KBC04_04960 [Candidatus Babeliales bacterium]|nr:hypothetical protein [Candidatus Babeliales bacterium]MBP9844317.1 hypothetical protein [Candidatus Babeliales bacterium]
MNKLFFITCIILFSEFQWQEVTANQTPEIPVIFTIPIINNRPDFDHANLPLCDHRPGISDVAKLFIMTRKLDTLLEKTAISQLTKTQQRKITTDVHDIQKQIQDMALDTLKFHERLNDRRENPTRMMLQQYLLIGKLDKLQTYLKLANRSIFNEQTEKIS